jgi:2-keto-3-deoxy-L-rhamnonate aldolase RhmA
MGIMVPMLEIQEQAEDLACWCRCRPEGVRGVGFGFAHDNYKGSDIISAMREENERTLVIALIETATGIANVDTILSVSGIDVGWFGHYDLTNSMGISGDFSHPVFHKAVSDLVAACNKHGKACGYLATSVAMAREWQAKGFRSFCYGTNVIVFQSALPEALRELKA